MKKITLLLLFLTFSNTFSQDKKEGNRPGTVFYPTIDKNEKNYTISVDLYELGRTKYIEAELYNDNDEKLSSKLLKLVFKDKKYYLSEEGKENKEEKIVTLYDISFKLDNPDNNLSYPKLKIKILDTNYQVLDYSQKIFY